MSKTNFCVFALVLALCACSMLTSLGRWQLKGSDEPRYAQVAREMLETGQYVLPHINGKPYPDKPPLYFWLAALAGNFFGDVTPHAARLPSALAGLLLVVLTFFIGRLLFDSATGTLAAGVLLTTEQFFSTTTSARLDSVFSFWITLSLFLLYKSSTIDDGNRRWSILAWMSIACAVLTKGPTGIVLPLLTMILYLFLTNEKKKISRLSINTGLLLCGGLCSLWLVPACLQAGAEYTRNILLRQSFGRVVEAFAHKAPVYFYLASFPVDFLPWTIFLPAVIFYYLKFRKRAPAVLFPFVWCVVVFLFFSCISGKRSIYLLPMYPAAAILMGKFWRDLMLDEEVWPQVIRWKLFTVPCLLTGVVLICTGGAALGASFDIFPGLHLPKAGALLSGSAGIIAGATGVRLLRAQLCTGAWDRTAAVMITGFCILALPWLWWIKPAIETGRPEQVFCETILKTVRPQDKLYASFEPEFFNYFLHRYPIPVVRDIQHVERLINSPDQIYFLVKDRDFDRLPQNLKQQLSVIARSDIGHKTIYFLAKRAP